MSKLLSQQLNELCQKLAQNEPLCEITSALIDEGINLRLEFDDANEKISKFLSWQDSEQGKNANLPRIEERHKEILFTEWEKQLIKGERATSRAKTMMNSITQLVNDSLYATNLISDCIPGKLPKVKETDSKWKQELVNKNQQINKLQGISWDIMWTYLIKPHNQQMEIKCLSNAISCIIQYFSDATYTGQLHSRLSHPAEVKDMLKIYHLGTLNAGENQ